MAFDFTYFNAPFVPYCKSFWLFWILLCIQKSPKDLQFGMEGGFSKEAEKVMTMLYAIFISLFLFEQDNLVRFHILQTIVIILILKL